MGEAYEKTGKPYFSMIAYNKALVAIQTRLESIRAEKLNATVRAAGSSSPKGTLDQLSHINELNREELQLKNKYREILSKIEGIRR